MSDTPTPETDKSFDNPPPIMLGEDYMDYLARLNKHGRELFQKLERERDEARREAERWRDNWTKKRVISMIVTTELPWEKPDAETA